MNVPQFQTNLTCVQVYTLLTVYSENFIIRQSKISIVINIEMFRLTLCLPHFCSLGDSIN